MPPYSQAVGCLQSTKPPSSDSWTLGRGRYHCLLPGLLATSLPEPFLEGLGVWEVPSIPSGGMAFLEALRYFGGDLCCIP